MTYDLGRISISSFILRRTKDNGLWDKGFNVTPVVVPPCEKHFGWAVNDF